MDWTFLGLAAASGLLFTAGDILLKYWAESAGKLHFVGALLLYLVAAVALGFSFRRREVAVAVAVLVSFNVIAISVAGFYLFGESLAPRELAGIALAVIAVVLLNV